MINVTKTYLPDFNTYTGHLQRAWQNGWITNNGILVQELEQKLKEYLRLNHLLYTNNGTVVLQMAIKALGITKEIITTPFSYVATTNAIIWEGCKPVFVDIEAQSFCIDPTKIEAKITRETQAILATHVYGFPCALEAIADIASRHKLKVIYDGAHAFGVQYKSSSLLNYGDVSTCSFHATKLFHTVEGGCITTQDEELARKLMLYRQFGHVYDDYLSVGINAKNSEFHAAMGLSILPDMNKIIASRQKASEYYTRNLTPLILVPNPPAEQVQYNFAYYPVLLPSEAVVLQVMDKLKQHAIIPRRYFMPSLNTLSYIPYQACPVSEDIASRILCLPLFYEIGEDIQEVICHVINTTCKH